MRLSTKSRFAIQVMIEVALHEAQGPVSLQVVGERLRISRTYLELLTGRLRSGGLLSSSRGRAGGYVLGRQASEVSVADIVTAIETPAGTEALAAGASDVGLQLTQALCSRLSRQMVDIMRGVTLDSLVAEQLASQGERAQQRPAPANGVYARAAQRPVRPVGINSVFNLSRAGARG